jgi:multiple sugar transport system substrate-binding protein
LLGNEVLLRGMTWDHARGHDPMVVTSELYAEAHPGVRIVWQKRSLQAFADRPLAAMADEYDLMVIDHPHVGEAAVNGLLLAFCDAGRNVELTQLAAESAGVSHRSYNFDGKQWGLAIDAATPIAIYRPDLLDSAPTRWSEVVTLAESGKVVWPLMPINALMGYFNQLASIGAPFGENGVGADPATGTMVLEQMLAVARHVPRACLAMDPIGGYEWLAARSSHAYIPYLYGYSNYSRPGFRLNRVRAANIPALGDDGPKGSPIGGTGIAVSSRSKHADVALDYAFWIASAEVQRGAFFEGGGQPGNIVAWRDAGVNAASDNFFLGTLETLERSYLRPRHNGYMHFQAEGGDLVHACLRGDASPGETVAAVNAAYDRSLQQ